MSYIVERLIETGGILAVLWAFSVWFEWHNLFKPTRKITTTPKDKGLEFEDVTFVAEDGKLLHGWWIPHPDATGTILYCHGNADCLSGRVDLCADLHQLGVNIFIFDYRGYGKSCGVPTEKGLYRDARAAYEVVRARYDDSDAPPVIVYGASLGGAVAAQLVLERSARGLVLECTFTSVLEMGQHLYPLLPVRLVTRMRFDTLSKIGRIAIPKLVSHSRDDLLIPFDMGQRLFNAARGEKDFITLRGNHDEAGWIETPAYWTALEGFVRRHLPTAQ
ncbi:MAG: alpha/beta hydrolase [bacterium]